MIEALKSSEFQFTGAAEALGAIGPDAHKSVPTLIEMLRVEVPRYGTELEDTVRAASALGNIGPDARTAVPLLIELAEVAPLKK